MPKLKETAFYKWVTGNADQDVEGDLPAPKGVTNPPTTQPPAEPPKPGTISADVRAMIEEAAEGYCELLTVKKLALPNALAGIKADYIQAALDDKAMPLAEGGSRVKALKARLEGNEQHVLTTEKVADKATKLRVVPPAVADDEEKKLAKLEEEEREYQRKQKKTA